MFLVVGDEVVECEAIVAGDEVDALFGFSRLVSVEIRAPQEAIGKAGDRVILAANEGPYIIAKTTGTVSLRGRLTRRVGPRPGSARLAAGPGPGYRREDPGAAGGSPAWCRESAACPYAA